MAQSKTKFRSEWLKKRDGNGHLLEWCCKTHESDKCRAICKLCDKEIQVASGGVHALLQNASKNIHKQKATFHFATTHTKKDSEQHLYQVHQAKVKWEACPLKYHNKVPNKHQSKISS